MRRAFTLIELLVVIGIISILSTMTIVAVAPRKNLSEATDAQRKHNIKELQNAQYQYLIDHGEFAADQDLPSTEATQMPICRYSNTDASCINVDALVEDYIACVAFDSMETNALYTGYSIFTNAGRVQVRSTYIGLGPATHVCENSATSSASSAASSSVGSQIGDPPPSSSSSTTTSSSAITSASSSSSTTTSSSAVTSVSSSSTTTTSSSAITSASSSSTTTSSSAITSASSSSTTTSSSAITSASSSSATTASSVITSASSSSTTTASSSTASSGFSSAFSSF